MQRKLKILKVFDFPYLGQPQEISLTKGLYIFECWGASGEIHGSYQINENGCDQTKGRGGYTKGYMYVNETTKFFVYVGEKGTQSISKTIFNSNNFSTLNGGGATDIRLIGGDWFLFDSLKSRIMVAGAGGNGERYCGGDGGGINGTQNTATDQDDISTTPGTQNSPGKQGYLLDANNAYWGHGADGKFGFSGEGYCYNKEDIVRCDIGASGGSGYYGGGGTVMYGSGSGGSSFISGHPGCDAIDENSREGNIIHTSQPIHYSKAFFFKTGTIPGNQLMISPENQLVIGHSGNGFARITLLTNFYLSCQKRNRDFQFFLYLFIVLNK